MRAAVRAQEIIDPAGERRRDLARRVRRVVLPILGVTLVVGAMAGVGWRSYEIARRGTQRLSHDLLVATQGAVAQDVAAYLSPATQGAAVARDMLSHGALQNGDNSFQPFAAALLRQVSQMDAFFLANSDGDFELVQRSGDSGTESVIVTARSRQRLRSEFRSDADGNVVGREPARASTYDPRTSLYYRGALGQTAEGGSVKHLPGGDIAYWSYPSLFKPTSEPIITRSIGYHTSDNRDHVVAVTIALDRLSAFLGGLKIGKSGRAAIVDRDGRIVAAPDLAQSRSDPSGLRLGRGARAKTDADLLRAFDLARVRGLGPQGFTLDGRRYISLAAALPSGAPDWLLLIVVPAKDFAAFTAADTRSTFFYLVITLLLAAALAGVLVWQNRRSDRLFGQLAARGRRAAEDRAALQALLADPHLLDPGVEAPVLTERLAGAAQAARAGIWRLLPEGGLRCDDSYDARHDTHAAGMGIALERREEQGAAGMDRAFSTPDAGSDPRTRLFYRQHMRGNGTRALHVVPVGGRHGTAALLVLEDALRFEESAGFVDMLAGVVGLRLRAEQEAARPVRGGAAEAAAEAAADVPGAVPAFRAAEPDAPRGSLLVPPREDAAPGEGLYPAVAVLVLTFSDSGAERMPEPGDSIRLVRELAEAMQDLARRHGLFSVKLAGHRLVAIAGCTAEPDPGAPLRLAEAALEMRDLCLSRLSAADIEPAFTMGLDVGPALGAALGREPAIFNLWGDTVRVAEAMAQNNAVPGAIQVTEAMYARLRGRFLFRNRGAFYTPRTGIARAYVLAGRQ